MCGIAGIILKNTGVVLPSQIKEMTDAIQHRGPDDEGYFCCGPVGLGSRRLSIIDLSPAGHMPMERSNRFVCVYNGEIYNHNELREELIELGHRFQSGTDTEVLLASYEEWGEQCLSRFNGMWGFAIFDRVKNTIFCARDRFGIKPFYYLNNNNEFVFGSEIKQLLPHLKEKKVLHELLVTFLISGATDYSDDTFFEGIKKLPSSHYLTYNLIENTHKIDRWYYPKLLNLSGLSLQSLIDEFEIRLSNSIKLRLRSDVRVGTCLSGGLDSSVIAAIASDEHRDSGALEKFRAITAISSDPSLDESSYAKIVVDHCNLEWAVTHPTQEDFLKNIDTVIQTQDEPFPTPSMIMQFFVMKQANQTEIKVLLDGQGADELLLGYPIYRGAYLNSLIKLNGFFNTLKVILANRNSHTITMVDTVKYMFGMKSSALRTFWSLFKHNYFIKKVLPPDILKQQEKASQNILELQLLDIYKTVLPALLRYEDRNSMACSIETRLPFLDYNVVEFCLSLPIDAKIKDGWSKYLLRCVASKFLPDSIAWRKSKLGFEAPDADWIIPYLETMKYTVLDSIFLRKITHKNKLSKAFDRLDLRSQWRIFVVARWASIFQIENITSQLSK